jgi:hypothetical protein
MRSAHISHDRGAICPFTATSPAASMALRAEFRTAAGLRLTPPSVSRGEPWTVKPVPGRGLWRRRPRTGGLMPLSSRTGVSGGELLACSTRGGLGRLRRGLSAAGIPETFAIGSGGPTRCCDRRERSARPCGSRSALQEPGATVVAGTSGIPAPGEAPARVPGRTNAGKWYQTVAIPCEDRQSCA